VTQNQPQPLRIGSAEQPGRQNDRGAQSSEDHRALTLLADKEHRRLINAEFVGQTLALRENARILDQRALLPPAPGSPGPDNQDGRDDGDPRRPYYPEHAADRDRTGPGSGRRSEIGRSVILTANLHHGIRRVAVTRSERLRGPLPRPPAPETIDGQPRQIDRAGPEGHEQKLDQHQAPKPAADRRRHARRPPA